MRCLKKSDTHPIGRWRSPDVNKDSLSYTRLLVIRSIKGISTILLIHHPRLFLLQSVVETNACQIMFRYDYQPPSTYRFVTNAVSEWNLFIIHTRQRLLLSLPHSKIYLRSWSNTKTRIPNLIKQPHSQDQLWMQERNQRKFITLFFMS